MAAFVDKSAGASTNYNPATRLPTGGSDTSYLTMTLGQAGEAPGVTINLRGGEVDALTAQLTLNEAGTSYIPWEDEVCWITNNCASSDTIQIGNVITNLGKVGNQLEIRGAGSNNDCVFANGGGTSTSELHLKIVDYIGIPFRNSGPSGDFEGSMELVNCPKPLTGSGSGGPSTWSEVILRDCLNDSGSGRTGVDITSGTHTIQNLKVIRGGLATSGAGMVNTTGTGILTIEDGYSVGVGADIATTIRPVFQEIAGTLTISGGSWNGNVYDPLAAVYGGTPTIAPAATFNEFIVADDAPNVVRNWTAIMWDSGHGDSAANGGDPSVISLREWVDQFGASRIVWLPDDSTTFTQTKVDSGNILLDAKGEIGAESASSSAFSLGTTTTTDIALSNQPFTLYRDSGSDNLTIEIDTDTLKTCVVLVNGTPHTTFDLEDGAKFIGNDTTFDPKYLIYVLSNTDFSGNTIATAQTVTSDSGAYQNMWDDLPSLALKTQNYTVPTTIGTQVIIDVDRVKWFNLDISVNRVDLEALFPRAGSLKSFLNYKLLTIPTDATDAIKADNWDLIFAGISNDVPLASSALTSVVDQENLYSVGAFRIIGKIRGDSIQADIGLTAVYTDGADVANHLNLTAWANATCSAAVAIGGYPVIELPRKNQTVASGLKDGYFLTTSDVAVLVNVFEANGFSVLTAQEAANSFRGIGGPPTLTTPYSIRSPEPYGPQSTFYQNYSRTTSNITSYDFSNEFKDPFAIGDLMWARLNDGWATLRFISTTHVEVL